MSIRLTSPNFPTNPWFQNDTQYDENTIAVANAVGEKDVVATVAVFQPVGAGALASPEREFDNGWSMPNFDRQFTLQPFVEAPTIPQVNSAYDGLILRAANPSNKSFRNLLSLSAPAINQSQTGG